MGQQKPWPGVGALFCAALAVRAGKDLPSSQRNGHLIVLVESDEKHPLTPGGKVAGDRLGLIVVRIVRLNSDPYRVRSGCELQLLRVWRVPAPKQAELFLLRRVECSLEQGMVVHP